MNKFVVVQLTPAPQIADTDLLVKAAHRLHVAGATIASAGAPGCVAVHRASQPVFAHLINKLS